MGFVTVKVEGDDQEQVNGVAAGVMVGLENTGFKNVKLAVEYEAKDMEAVINRDRSLDAPSTMLATLKMRNPNLFDQPVMVHVPVVKPTGGLTVFQTEDNRILEEKDEVPKQRRTQEEVDAAMSAIRASSGSPKVEDLYMSREELGAILDKFEPSERGDDWDITLRVGGKRYQLNPEEIQPTPKERHSGAEIEAAAGVIESGMRYPYDGRHLDCSPARAAALGILNDLSDRGGVGNELDMLDDGLRQEITDRITAIVETANNTSNTVELYNAVQTLVEKGVMSRERAAGFLHSMNTLAQH